ncbi:MAG: hypothetical protein NTZ27_01855 [Ignavibacteriales bacterium]|nr:hypothetical protein [Ignavibacteriales bacterium]
MKKTTYFILFIILSALITYAGVDLLKFSAHSQDGNVVVSWQTITESNLNYFVVERKTVNGSFMEIGNVSPRSDKNYEYVDQSAFKTSDQLYVYRLKIVDNDGSVSYSQVVSVTHSNISSVKRTWGSIKALFR